MSFALDPLFTPERERQLLQLQRYRAEFVTLALWRLVHERTHWRTITIKSDAAAGGGVKAIGAGNLKSMSSAVYDVRIPAAARLAIAEHQVRLYRGDLRRARESLNPEENHAMEEWLFKERHSSIFRLHGGTVHRNESASHDLARAALKLMAATRVILGG